jgi:GntR family transcriptional regulator/MocR family aminotransferase
MKQGPIYLQICESIRQDIETGRLKPADRLPSLRQMTDVWDCTPGTVQRAYQELASQGLVTSRPGQGTHVVAKPPQQNTTPLRKAALLHRAEAFLLETWRRVTIRMRR